MPETIALQDRSGARHPGTATVQRRSEAARVGAVMDYLTEGNRTLVWVGIPNDDNPEVTARMQVQDEVVRAEAAKRTGDPALIQHSNLVRFADCGKTVGDDQSGAASG